MAFLGFGWMLCFRKLCTGVTHPPAPLERGVWDTAFFLVMRGLWRGDISPLERGFKGCVTERDAGCVEQVVLLFEGVAFLGFG